MYELISEEHENGYSYIEVVDIFFIILEHVYHSVPALVKYQRSISLLFILRLWLFLFSIFLWVIWFITEDSLWITEDSFVFDCEVDSPHDYLNILSYERVILFN